MTEDRRYLVLDFKNWFPEENLPSILGAVVKNPLNPLEDYSENYKAAKWDEEFVCDFLLPDENHDQTPGLLHKTEFGRIRMSPPGNLTTALKGKLISIIQLKRQHDRFKEIWRDAETCKKIIEWSKRSGDGLKNVGPCLVTGVLMCTNMAVASSKEEARAWLLEGKMPIGTMEEIRALSQGTPPTGVRHTPAGAGTFFTTSEVPQIFALQLYRISLEHQGFASFRGEGNTRHADKRQTLLVDEFNHWELVDKSQVLDIVAISNADDDGMESDSGLSEDQVDAPNAILDKRRDTSLPRSIKGTDWESVVSFEDNEIGGYRVDGTEISSFVRSVFSSDGGYTCFLRWQLAKCVGSALAQDAKFFSSILTLSGSPKSAYATTCEAYLRQTWPKVGLDVLEAVRATLALGSFRSNTVVMEIEKDYYEPDMDRVEINVIAEDIELAVQITEVLVWLAMTFRLANPDGLYCSFVNVQGGKSTNSLWIALAELGEPVKGGDDDSCWHEAFRGFVIASGFPVKTQVPEGVELPFNAMTHLTGMLYGTDLSEVYDSADEDQRGPRTGIFYTGVNSVLYPVERGANDTVIRWHYKRKNNVTVPPADHSWLRDANLTELLGKPAILGYTPKAVVHLGTEDRFDQYSVIAESSADVEAGRGKINLRDFSLGVSHMGVGAGANMEYKYFRGQELLSTGDDRSYNEIVEATRGQPVILYDTKTGSETGWLVSQLSVILDLIHLKAHRENYWTKQEHADAYAALQADAGSAAKKVLNDYKIANKTLYTSIDTEKPFAVKDLVKTIYIEMCKRIQLDYAAGDTNSVHLLGWDLIEILYRSSTSKRRQIEFHSAILPGINPPPSWFPLARAMPVFFGDSLGNIISPADPRSMGFVPNKRALTASLHALPRVKRDVTKCIDQHLRMAELVWQVSSERHVCYQNNGSHDYCIQLLVKNGNHKCHVEGNPADIHDDGAVVFGAAVMTDGPGKLKKKLANRIAPSKVS